MGQFLAPTPWVGFGLLDSGLLPIVCGKIHKMKILVFILPHIFILSLKGLTVSKRMMVIRRTTL